MITIYDVIDKIRKTAKSEYDKGKQFESAVRFFLKNDPVYSSKFSDVWSWEDAPTNDGADYGIDIVAKDAVDGSYWAIQVKCYDSTTLNFESVSTFFGAIGRLGDQYKHNMIVATTSKYSPNLDKVANKWGTVRIDSEDIDESHLDWNAYLKGVSPEKRHFYDPKEYQKKAIRACLDGFENNDRGKLIMACGTGKTLTSLRLTEQLCKEKGFVLFLAPSISLVAQSMRYWASQAKKLFSAEVVCSDESASRPNEDLWENSLADLPYPSTTDAETLASRIKKEKKDDGLTVIFSTYQSIKVISDAQKLGIGTFDLIICDEAHRTTGAAIANDFENSSNFIKVHNDNFIQAKKRLYMTATPKIYGDTIKKKARIDDYEVSSMDDEKIYGPEFFRLGFSKAIDLGELSDYRPVALKVSEDAISDYAQQSLSDVEGLKINEAARIIGCWKGLATKGRHGSNNTPLRSAVAFCNTIAESKKLSSNFQKIVDAYIEGEKKEGREIPHLTCKAKHVDGSMDSSTRKELLRWLAEKESDNDGNPVCHILFNARCLAEGVDVPSLDAVMFLRPKKSQIDVIQAVGRVMRSYPGKKYGYIILPIVIPSGVSPEDALDSSEDFQTVWSVAKALRSHDERMEATINALQYDKNAKPPVDIIDGDPEQEGEDDDGDGTPEQTSFNFSEHQLQQAVNAVLVKKCGTKVYWEDWAKDIARIAEKHIAKIKHLVTDDKDVSGEFGKFLRGLKDSLNENITADDASEMLAQHMITLPVFEALFGGRGFAQENPVSQAMEKMVSILREKNIEDAKEKQELESLYDSVRLRCEQIETDAGRQKLIKELYENFFKQAFTRTSDKMGIVYTPTEIVDYILYNTDRLLKKEFGQSLADNDIHILDPFTGTGTFIQRLIATNLIPNRKIEQKYKNEIHCNEIVPLAYYIATINIENAYHNRTKEDKYVPFSGAVLTDTFQMTEDGDPLDWEIFGDNTKRVIEQNKLPVRIICGNPPWSIGQQSANDNNANENYPTLDKRIEQTYAQKSDAGLLKSLYDQYIRAFRWASDRIGEKGIISFVTNGGWLRGGATAGFRRSLCEEFNKIYVFDLRGNARTSGEQRRKEKDNVFGQGTRTPVTIVFLVKNPQSKDRGKIFYHDIGDYLTKDEKLAKVADNVEKDNIEWQEITMDRHGDWLNQRDDSWYEFAPIGIDKQKGRQGIFNLWSYGIVTNKDAWLWSYDKKLVANNAKNMILAFNSELKRYKNSTTKKEVKDFVNKDDARISWSRALVNRFKRGNELTYNADSIKLGLYRPFSKQWVYTDEQLVEMQYQTNKMMPQKKNAGNMIMSIVKSDREFSALITDCMPDLQLSSNGQCFPLYYYDTENKRNTLFGTDRIDAINDEALKVFRAVYPNGFPNRLEKDGGKKITKEDIFYYIYGIFHCPEYKERFAANLSKELPRIPFAHDFAAFSNTGRGLAQLHLNYDTGPMYNLKESYYGNKELLQRNPGRVDKLRWGKKVVDGKKVDDYSVIIYNDQVVLRDVPLSAQNYIVNGRSALAWLFDRYQVKVDKNTGIINDPNDFSEDPRYIIDLIKRVTYISVQTVERINMLPKINEIKPDDNIIPKNWKVI